jgi:hypothetical protein
VIAPKYKKIVIEKHLDMEELEMLLEAYVVEGTY